MSLVNPGLGDVLDRCTILARKIVEGREDLRPEFAELTKKHGFDATVMLAALNAAIWQREDRLRELAQQLEPAVSHKALHVDANLIPIAQTAIEIQKLNDRRAALIAELNGTPSEKLYK